MDDSVIIWMGLGITGSVLLGVSINREVDITIGGLIGLAIFSLLGPIGFFVGLVIALIWLITAICERFDTTVGRVVIPRRSNVRWK